MRTVRISNAVWEKIAERGQFGESVDDVLRRVFGLQADAGSRGKVDRPTRVASVRRRNKSTNRLSTHVSQGRLILQFASGERQEYSLPQKTDIAGIRRVRDRACEFAVANEATLGQVNAVKKALTDAGYYVSRR